MPHTLTPPNSLAWVACQAPSELVLCKKIDLKLGVEQLCKYQPSLCSARGGERAMRHHCSCAL